LSLSLGFCKVIQKNNRINKVCQGN